MLAAYPLDRQDAHQQAAGEPEQELHADNQRQPAVKLAGADMEAELTAPQNQVLTPATKLKPPVSSPRARVKRAVSPNCRSHDMPI